MHNTFIMITLLLIGVALHVILERTRERERNPRDNIVSMPGFLVLWAATRAVFRPRFNAWDMVLFLYILIAFEANGPSPWLWIQLLLGIFISSVFQHILGVLRAIWNNKRDHAQHTDTSSTPAQ